MAIPSSSTSDGPTRPPFRPTTLPPRTPSPLATPAEAWVEVLVASCHFGLSTFLATLKDLCLHPERNSGLILRADQLPPRSPPIATPPEEGLDFVEDVRVRIMPKQPNRDPKLEQSCLFFRREGTHEQPEEGRVIYVPEIKRPEDAPFYYPPVQRLAFRYEGLHPSSDAVEEEVEGDEETEVPIRGRISIHYLPWPSLPPTLNIPRLKPRRRSPLAGPPVGADTAAESNGSVPPPAIQENGAARGDSALSMDERIQRICQGLMERLYKHGYGQMVGYKKRVHHDVLVAREPFQDLYMILKDRHRHLDSRAPKPGSTKVEDVKRHVFKESGLPDDPSLPTTDISHWGSQDVAIAAFLMLLWKDMYPPISVPEPVEEWDTWSRPPGGFVDLGCGNGLLVHILTAEGYAGMGYELRKRRTWPLYPPSTQARLVELPIDLPSWFPETIEQWDSGSWPGKEHCVLPEGGFIIGNHADELTPWLPLLSLIPNEPIPHLSLPCCLHTLDSSFDPITFTAPPHPHNPTGGFEKGLEEGQSRYKAYLMWLGWEGLQCGWEWEREPLRIPSTKGWAIIARKRWANAQETRECRVWALEQVNSVRQRGIFAVREKEGKDH